MKTYESAENYLETILLLHRKNGQVRSVDIAAELGFTKPSVSRAMKLLRGQEYIHMEPNGLITLTDSGKDLAEKIYARHSLFAKALISIGVDPETALEDACRIEHVVSQQTFDKLREHMAKK